MKIDSRAGRDNIFHLYLPAPSAAPKPKVEPDELPFGAVSRRRPPFGDESSSISADDRHLSDADKSISREIDVYRDMLEEGSAKRACRALCTLLEALPSHVSPYVVFRIKANIGHCKLQLSDKEAALNWFDDAVATAPTEPRAIALKAHAMLVRGEAADALVFAREQLKCSPDNEHVAAHLIEAAILLNDGTDPEPTIPVAIRERERVLIARCILRRQRDERPAWWNIAKLGARRFPASKVLKLVATEAEVDEIARACRGEIYRQATVDEKTRLRTAAAYLEECWRHIKTSEVPRRDDGLAALFAAMIARTLLDERDIAMTLARDLIEHADEDDALIMAGQMANAVGDEDVAKAAMAKLPDEGPAAFLKGIAASNVSDWSAAAEYFAKATVPESERLLAGMVMQLGSIGGMNDGEARSALKDAIQQFGSDPRVLIVLCQMAEEKRLPDVATEAYRKATALIGPNLQHYSARLMIASHAYRLDDFDVIIRTLDGHVDTGIWTKELQWLADAHASEHPPRPRNLRFFDGLPKHVRQLATIARGHASKLLDQKREKEAEPILRRIVEEVPTDVFAQLKLVEAVERLGRPDDAKARVRAADEAAMQGPNTYRLRWAHQLRDAGEPERAIAYALDLLRSNSSDPKMALGYVSLVFGGRSEAIIPIVNKVAADCWVAIENSAGDQDSFLIDDMPSLLGIDAVPPSHARAQRVLGLHPGQTVEVTGIGRQIITWTVKEVKSKYLAVLHAIMQTFEQRFPTAKGLWRFSVTGPDVQPVLDVIREQAKAKRESTENLYVKGRIPLAFAAQAVGADVMSFAHYLRSIGLEITTTGGTHVDKQAGIIAARDYKGVGATFDTYTAITAAEMDCLEVLSSWYGRLAVPASTIEVIDELIAYAAAGVGKEAMSIGWRDSGFFKEEINDEILRCRIEVLEAMRAKIVARCEVVAAVVPDDLSPELAQFTRTTGREGMDAMYVAASRGDVLVSDDLFYRQLASSLVNVDGVWLQVVLMAAFASDEISAASYAKACAQLAYRRHGNLWLEVDALVMISEECSAEEFAAVCHYIGSRGAHMWSHTLLVSWFLRRIWERPPATELKQETLTSAIVGSLLRHRCTDWHYCLAVLWLTADGNPPLQDYLVRWIHGHFLPVALISAAERQWRIFLRQAERPPSNAVSRRALHAGDLPAGPVKLNLNADLVRQTRLDTRPEGGAIYTRSRKRARRRKSRGH